MKVQKVKIGPKCLILIKKDIFKTLIILIISHITILKRKGRVPVRVRVPYIYSGHFSKSRFKIQGSYKKTIYTDFDFFRSLFFQVSFLSKF